MCERSKDKSLLEDVYMHAKKKKKKKNMGERHMFIRKRQ